MATEQRIFGSRPATAGAAVASDEATILLKRVAWGAIFAGIVLSLITHLLLNMLGLGIGVSTIDPLMGGSPEAGTFSIMAGIWWTVAGIIAAFVGGFAAGRLAGKPDGSTGGWHGLTTWAATMLVIFWLLTSTIGSIIGGAFGIVGNAVSGLGQMAAEAVPAVAEAAGGPLEDIQQQIRNQTAANTNDPQAAQDALVSSITRMLTGDQAEADAARQQAIDALAQLTGITPQEAETRLNEWQTQYNEAIAQAEETARQAAETASNVVAQAAIYGFIALLLGAIAGWFGGRAGTPHETRIVQRTPAATRP